MVRSAGGVLSWKNRMRNDDSAMTTRTTTGTTVHNTSTNVLCVVRDGVGWALALNLTITITSSARTNTVMPVMIHNTKVWRQITSSITGLADSWRPICQGVGCPKPANAAPSGSKRAAARAAIAVIRKKTGIVVSTPWMATACGQPAPRTRHEGASLLLAASGDAAGELSRRCCRSRHAQGPMNHNSTALATCNHNSTALGMCNHISTRNVADGTL